MNTENQIDEAIDMTQPNLDEIRELLKKWLIFCDAKLLPDAGSEELKLLLSTLEFMLNRQYGPGPDDEPS